MIDTNSALALVKARLNRMPLDTSLDDYLTARIGGTIDQLTEAGIHLNESMGDLMLVVDMTVWDYQNRDKPNAMPEWLRLKRRERWLQEVHNDP